MSSVFKTIGLLDHLGHGNLGDDATLQVVMHNIKKRWPEAKIVGLSLNPSDTQQRHGISSHAIRRDSKFPAAPASPAVERRVVLKVKMKSALARYPFFLMLLRSANTVIVRLPKDIFQELSFLVESFQVARSLDLLIICGGGQLLDSWGGPWRFPYTLFKWVALARLASVQCYFLNVGAGPIRHRLSKWFIRRALALSQYASFRDEESSALVRAIGFKRAGQVSADVVYNLDVSAAAKTMKRNRTQCEQVVGIAPMAYCDPRVYWDKDQEVYKRLIDELAMFGHWLIGRGHSIRVFSTDIRIDSYALEELDMALKAVGGVASCAIRRESILTTENLVSQMSSMNYIVTCRFHGVVLAHILNKPLLAIAHHPKVSTLMEAFGLAAYCVDIRSVSSGVLIDKFRQLMANELEVRRRMAETVERHKVTLTRQFDSLFSSGYSSLDRLEYK